MARPSISSRAHRLGWLTLGGLAALFGCGGRTETFLAVESAGATGGALASAGSSPGSAAGDGGGGSAGLPFGGAGVAGGGSAGVAGEGAPSGAGTTGAAGSNWHQSKVAFCPGPSPFGVYQSIDLWSRPDAVYALVDNRVFANTGNGWAALSNNGRGGYGGLSGFADGPLIRYGGLTARCGIEFMDSAGVDSCSGAVEPTHLSVVDRKHAFASYGSRVLTYDGIDWRQLGAPLGAAAEIQISQIWAHSRGFALAARSGVYVAEAGAAPTRQAALDEFDREQLGFRAIWGVPKLEQLWVGNDKGELFLHEAGVWRRERSADGAACSAIRHIWASDAGSVFFTTENALYRATSGGWEAILELPCDGESRVWSVWGNSTTEVFVAFETGSASAPCGDVGLKWWDGTAMHAL